MKEAVRRAERYCDEFWPVDDPENAAYKKSLRIVPADDDDGTTESADLPRYSCA